MKERSLAGTDPKLQDEQQAVKATYFAKPTFCLFEWSNVKVWTYRSHVLSKNLLLAKKCLDTRSLLSTIYLYGNFLTKLN